MCLIFLLLSRTLRAANSKSCESEYKGRTIKSGRVKKKKIWNRIRLKSLNFNLTRFEFLNLVSNPLPKNVISLSHSLSFSYIQRKRQRQRQKAWVEHVLSLWRIGNLPSIKVQMKSKGKYPSLLVWWWIMRWFSLTYVSHSLLSLFAVCLSISSFRHFSFLSLCFNLLSPLTCLSLFRVIWKWGSKPGL